MTGGAVTDASTQRVQSWTAAGSPEQCVEHLRIYERMGIDAVALRCTSWSQMGQLRRVIEDVLPHFADTSASVRGSRRLRIGHAVTEGAMPTSAPGTYGS